MQKKEYLKKELLGETWFKICKIVHSCSLQNKQKIWFCLSLRPNKNYPNSNQPTCSSVVSAHMQSVVAAALFDSKRPLKESFFSIFATCEN